MALQSREKTSEGGCFVGKERIWVQVLRRGVNRSPTYMTVDNDTTRRWGFKRMQGWKENYTELTFPPPHCQNAMNVDIIAFRLFNDQFGERSPQSLGKHQDWTVSVFIRNLRSGLVCDDKRFILNIISHPSQHTFFVRMSSFLSDIQQTLLFPLPCSIKTNQLVH